MPVVVVLALSIGVVDQVGAQAAPMVRRSQRGSVTQRIGTTDVEVVYNRPVARGRAIFGSLVPYGRTWHPGADSATTISFSTDVTVNNEPLAAGSYTLWAIPEQSEWTIVFSRAVGIWHTPYPSGQDALRLRVIPKSGEHMETLAFYFPFVDGTQAVMHLHWGSMVVPLTIVGK